MSSSLLNGSRSSSAPPPRAMTMTSTSGRESSSLRAPNLRNRGVALDGDFADLELDGGPAQGRVAEDVLLGVGVPAGDQPDPVGEQRQPLFPGLGEESFGSEGMAQPFNPGEEIAQPNGTDVFDGHVQAAGLQPELRLEEGHHPASALERRLLAVEDLGPDGGRKGDLGVHIPEGKECTAAATVQFDDLPFTQAAGARSMCVLSFWESNCRGQGLSGLVSAAVAGTVLGPAARPVAQGRRPAAGTVAFSAMCSPGGGEWQLHGQSFACDLVRVDGLSTLSIAVSPGADIADGPAFSIAAPHPGWQFSTTAPDQPSPTS